MTDTEKMVDKVEKMNNYLDHRELSFYMEGARNMLSVVKANIGLVAEVCPVCNGKKFISDTRGGEYIMVNEPCMLCKSTGVISKDGA